MTFLINGVNILPYIAYQGLNWQRSDVDGPNAGRMLNGELIRDRIAIKRRLEVSCRPVSTAEASIVLTAIEPEWVTVTYTDPMAGEDITKTMYSNNVPAMFCMITPDGKEMWQGITFPLIEK